MADEKSIQHPSLQEAMDEVSALKRTLRRLEGENSDLEIALGTAVEHGDTVEEELSKVNDRLQQEVEVRRRSEEKLRQLVGAIRRQKDDLEIALTTAIEHGDAIEEQLYDVNDQLNHEVAERRSAEGRLEQLVDTISQQNRDLEVLVDTIASHGDEINAEIREKLDCAEALAQVDPLTGVGNRRAFDEVLADEWRRCAREGRPLALLVADIDHFKRYNDHYGHLTGDECLKRVARLLAGLARRGGDLVARYGGEEFVVLLPGCELAEALARAEEGRLAVEGLAIEHEGSPLGRITLSLGVAALVPTAEVAAEVLFAAADTNLYRAKSEGRNRVTGANGHGGDAMSEGSEIIGEFSGLSEVAEGEYLHLGFTPSSVPLQQRWRNNGLSADFLGDYVTTFFPKNEEDPETVARQAEIRGAVAYIANELLENAMKYSGEGHRPISLKMLLGEERIIIDETNSVDSATAARYRRFVDELTAKNPMEFYVEQLEAKATDDAGASGLGFLTMINDYGVELAWRFVPQLGSDQVEITTEVTIPV